MPRPLKPSLWWLIIPVTFGFLVFLDRPRQTTSVHQAAWLRAGDTRLRTVEAGTGDTTLFLLHGFGESLFTWRAVLDRLARQYRVVAVDLPGFGGSEKPDSGYSVETMTRRLADFQDREIPGPTILVGHSMGGELAASLALARPDRVQALVLIAPAGWSVGLAGVADTMYPSKARAIGWYLSSRAFLLPEHDPEWLGEPDSAANYTLIGDQKYRQAAAKMLEEFNFRGFRDRFQELRQPVLLLWGELDPVIPYVLADSIAAAIPCHQRVSFPNALHRPQVEIPDTVAFEILRFAARPACSH